MRKKMFSEKFSSFHEKNRKTEKRDCKKERAYCVWKSTYFKNKTFFDFIGLLIKQSAFHYFKKSLRAQNSKKCFSFFGADALSVQFLDILDVITTHSVQNWNEYLCSTQKRNF